MRIDNTSKAKIYKKAEIGSHSRAPLPSEKLFVFVPTLITQDSGSLSKTFTHKINILPKPYFSRMKI